MNKERIFYISCTLLVMVIIFLFSHQPTSKTYKTSGIFVKPIECHLKEKSDKEFKDEAEEKKYWQDIKNKLHQAIRKFAHIFIYTLLSLFIYLTLKSFNYTVPDIYFYTLILCILYGISDEIHQHFVSRHAYFTDICADTFGAVIVIISVWLKNKINNLKIKGKAL